MSAGGSLEATFGGPFKLFQTGVRDRSRISAPPTIRFSDSVSNVDTFGDGGVVLNISPNTTICPCASTVNFCN